MAPAQTKTTLDDPRITQFGLFIEAARRLSRVIESSVRDQHQMTSIEFEAMLRIGRPPEQRMSMTQLADQMVLTSGGITRLIDRLAADGFVVRVACPEDRRIQWAQLTEDGLEKISTVLQTHLRDLDEHFFGVMSAAELEVLLPVLDRLRSNCSD